MGYPQPFKLSKGPDVIIEGLQPLATEIDKLKLLPGNPRKGDIQAVARSLEAFGQRKPIVAISDGTVIAGNHTLQAAQSLGWKKIAVVFVEDDEAKAKAYALADNRTAELGGYDNQALVDLISDVQLLDKELFAATGWENDDLAELIATLELQQLPTSFTDPDNIPDAPPAKTVPGDVWLLGPHRVVCGDSTSPTDVDKLMAGSNADMVWTDPPYGVAIVGGNHSLSPEERKRQGGLTIDNDDLSPLELEQFLRSALGEALNACRAGAVWFVAAPPGPLFVPFGIVLLELGIWRQTLVWLKSSLVMGRSDYHYRHEAIFYGWKPGAAHTEPPDRKGDTIWEFDRPSRNHEHPTMKPIALIERAIKNHTKSNEVVLDVFGGSGSTLIACHQTGRIARLMELDPRYVDVICRRFQEHTGIKPINQATNQEHDFLED
jgi:site-specific DNA-methyltransferase (adenine-specific)